MIRLRHIVIPLWLALPLQGVAQTDALDPWASVFRPLPLHGVAEAVTDRYHGRLLAAETVRPRPNERALGAQLVYRFRLLTPARHVLDIRVDAKTGRFLEVAGRGQIAARRHGPKD